MISNSFALKTICLSPSRSYLHSYPSRNISARFISTSLAPRVALNRPRPPPLAPKEQKEFEDLIRAAATPAAPAAGTIVLESGDELHPDARKKVDPEFEGDVNPKTGEVGGPKHEPVRHGEWSFGGRATDF